MKTVVLKRVNTPLTTLEVFVNMFQFVSLTNICCKDDILKNSK